jgi:DMSO reductase family type II enzyme chaperone
MEEILRFYRHFGLTLSPGAHDLPDNVPTVLEFVQFLTCREEGAAGRDAAESSRGAARDVVARHLLPWAAQTEQRFARREAGPFYGDLVAALHAFAQADLAFLGR